MNKLQKLLTGASTAIKGARAKFISEDMMFAQKKVVETLEENRRALERKLNSLNDLYPDSELSLRVVKKDFDPEEWARDTQNIKVQLINNEVELAVAKETHAEWFTELPKTVKKAPAVKKTPAKTE